MDKKLICHEIAMTSAKAYSQSDISSGIEDYTKALVKNYLKAYGIAKTKLSSAPPKKDGVSVLK